MKKYILAWTATYLTVALILGIICLKASQNGRGLDALPSEGTALVGASQIEWLTSLEVAQEESKKTGKPIFVDFYATWCAPCKMLDERTYPNPAVVAEAKQWVMLKIDADKQTALAGRYGIVGLPTLAVLRADGKPVVGTSGFLSATALVKFLSDARAQITKTPQGSSFKGAHS